MKYTFAALVSIIGICISYFTLKPEQWSQKTLPQQTALAKLDTSKNDVKRKSRGKLIWLSIKNGDQLYKGDIIQTSKSSSATITFLDTKTSINIESDTTIIVEKTNNNINLDVIEGGLFVKNSSINSSIQVKSGNKTVDISKGDASFSVDQSGSLGVKVHSGSAKANAGGKIVDLSANDIGQLSENGINKTKEKFLDLTPLYGQSLYLPLGSNKVTFKWRAFKKPWDIDLFIGRSKKLLKKIEQAKIVSFRKGEFIALIEKGELFWQLKGHDTKGSEKSIQSEIYKVNLLSKLSPTPLSPINNDTLKFKKNEISQMNFSWNNRSPLDKALIEISTNNNFSNIIFEKMTTSNDLSISTMKKEGLYFWRIKGYLKNSNQTITSDINQFHVKFFDKIVSPSPFIPEDQEMISLKENKNSSNLTFRWNKVDSAEKYNFVLERLNSNFKFKRSTKSVNLKIKGLKAGKYIWKVASVDKIGQVSQFSDIFNFKIRKQGLINWKVSKTKYEYVDKLPVIKIMWSKDQFEKKWLLTLSNSENFKNKRRFELSSNEWIFRPKSDDNYFFTVTSISSDKKILSKSDILQLNVSLKPLPSAPVYSKEMAIQFKASKNGFLKLAFDNKLKEKLSYQIQIKNLKGEIIRQTIFSQDKGLLKSLMPGRYWLSAKKQDIHGRVGPSGESRELIVPNQSQVKAPTINNIKIR